MDFQRQEYYDLLNTLGKSLMHYVFPNDFEVYICSLELTDSNDKTVEFFTFPVMPDQMEEAETPITNIVKTSGGITILETSSFIPTDIRLRGNFGKKLKIIIGNERIDASSISYSTVGGNFINHSGDISVKNRVFSNVLKTGYGSIKVLESIVFKSRQIDRKGSPYNLYFYNPALGNSYLVKITDFRRRQDYSTNMIWNYDLAMKSIAPITVRAKKDNMRSLRKTLTFSLLTKTANALATELLKELQMVVNEKL